MNTDASSNRVVLGRISGLYGVKGWVKIYSHTVPKTNILDYKIWYLSTGNGWKEYRLETGKPHGKGIIAKLEGLDDRDIASGMIGMDISIPREQLPSLEKDSYYWADLEGLEVKTSQGVELGRIDYLFDTGSNDVMVIKGDKQRLVPFIPDVVENVDLDTGVITVDWDPDF